MVHGPRGARTDDGILYTAGVPVRGHGLSVAVNHCRVRIRSSDASVSNWRIELLRVASGSCASASVTLVRVLRPNAWTDRAGF